MTLDYGGDHTDFNRKSDFDIGIMRILLSKATTDVSWRSADKNKFSKADVEITQDYLAEGEDDSLFLEGNPLLVSHIAYERKRGLRRRKLNVARNLGPIICEACNLDCCDFYGANGESAYDVHHAHLVSRGERANSTKDLHILCVNCHRIIHRTKPMPSVLEFRKILASRP
jgi:predicted HNH restriction endonuclease